MLPLFAELSSVLKANPLLGAGVTMAASGWVIVQAKSVPKSLGRTFQDQFSATLTVYDNEQAFDYLSVWLARHPGAQRARRVTVTEWWDRESEKNDFELTPGSGLHMIRQDGRFFWVRRTIEESSGQGYSNRRKQKLTITTLGRSQAPIKRLLEGCKSVHDRRDTVPVHIWAGGMDGYRLIERRAKRSMDTVYLDEAIKRSVIEDVVKFTQSREWYTARGVPYRRGYMLEGPPGTGKSTFIFALAGLIDKPVFIINPATITSDNGLQKALNEAGAGIVVIEDIDAVKITHCRAKLAEAKVVAVAAGAPMIEEDGAKEGITLSGLLNAIDGIGARDGRLLFITSNHADHLDAALLRPGRVDKRALLDLADMAVARQMFRRFFPQGDEQAFVAEIAAHLPISPADLQNRLLTSAEAAMSPDTAPLALAA